MINKRLFYLITVVCLLACSGPVFAGKGGVFIAPPGAGEELSGTVSAAKQKQLIKDRTVELSSLADKKNPSFTQMDREFVNGVMKYFGFSESKLLGKERFISIVKMLALLSAIELDSKDLNNGYTPNFPADIKSNLGNRDFAHDIHHITSYDLLFLQNVMYEKGIFSDLSKAVKAELAEHKKKIKGLIEITDSWKILLSNFEDINIVYPGFYEAFTDDLIRHIKEVNEIRAVHRYNLKEKGSDTDKELLVKYLGYLDRFDDENISIIGSIEKIKENALAGRNIKVVDINESILESIRPFIAEKGLKIEMAFAEGLPAVSGEQSKIMHIWSNLFTNARDAVFSNGGINGVSKRGRIKITTSKKIMKDRGFIEVKFSNTGKGVPAELLKDGKLFEKGRTTKESGSGEGLFIVRRIVENLGGLIYVSSRPGKETVFTVLLPAADAVISGPVGENITAGDSSAVDKSQ